MDGVLTYGFKDGGLWHLFAVSDVNDGYVLFNDLALDGDGNPHLSYANNSTRDLRYAWAYLQPELSSSVKTVSDENPEPGEVISYSLQIVNQGLFSTTFVLTDAIPLNTVYVPESAQASSGAISDSGQIHWSGTVDAVTEISATFAVTVEATLTEPVAIENIAWLSAEAGCQYQLSSLAQVGDWQEIMLPLVLRNQ